MKLLFLLLTPFPARGYGVDGAYVRPVPTDRNGPGEPRDFTQGYPGGCRAWLLVKKWVLRYIFFRALAPLSALLQRRSSPENML